MLKLNKNSIFISIIILGLFTSAVFFSLPKIVGTKANGLFPKPSETNLEISKLHNELFVADMHADTLLWDRPLLEKGTYGHVDFPRLRKGGIALQIFSVVTKAPLRPSVVQNSKDFFDGITLLSMAQKWPASTWGNLTARALYQVKKMDEAIAASKGSIRKILTRQDLFQFREDRKTQPDLVGVLISLEGAQAFAGDIGRMDELFNAGFRMIGPAHLFDNELAGSQSGETKYGFTELGREWLKAAQEKKVMIDLAHLSTEGINEALKVLKYPPVVSHTGVRGVCDIPRNLSDEVIKQIAAKKGLIGIGLWDQVLCSRDIMQTVKSMKHVCDLVGCQHVAIGSDWDGFVTTAVDAEHIGVLTTALQNSGFKVEDIRGIMGENMFRFLSENLP